MLVGAPLKGKVLIIDDVITAGTAVREVMSLIESAGAEPAAVVIGLNRQERGKGEKSAIQEVEADYNIPVVSIINLQHIMSYLREQGSSVELAKIEAYYQQYGV